MLRFLLLTSLAALGKYHLFCFEDSPQKSHMDLNVILLFLLDICFFFLVLAEPQPRYLEDNTGEGRVVGGEVARPNSWPWQVYFKPFQTL